MNLFVEKVTQLLKKQKITKNHMLSELNLSRNSFVDWNKRGTIPNAKTVSAIADYLNTTVDYLLGREDTEGHGLNDGNIDKYGLDGPGVTDILGYPTNEEKAIHFSHKLALQIDFSGAKLADIATFIGVTDQTILEWLNEKRNDYSPYYEKLSEFFNVDITYWTRPGAISPGIEPTSQEYFLILKYRLQNQINYMDYLPIEDFFPNCYELSESESKWLNSFRQLNEDNMDIIIGKIKELLKEQRHEPVAADEPLRKAK